MANFSELTTGSLPPSLDYKGITLPTTGSINGHIFQYPVPDSVEIDIAKFMKNYNEKEDPMPDMVYYWKEGVLKEWKIEKLSMKDLFFHLFEFCEGKDYSFILCSTSIRSLIGRCDITFDEAFTKVKITGGVDYTYYRKVNQDGDFWFIKVDESGREVNFWAGKAIYLGDQAFNQTDDYNGRRFGYIQIQEEGNPFNEKIIEVETGRIF